MSTFRTVYRPLTPTEQAVLESLKNKAEELETVFNLQPANTTREMALARTKLEEAVMWAVKGITG